MPRWRKSPGQGIGYEQGGAFCADERGKPGTDIQLVE